MKPCPKRHCTKETPCLQCQMNMEIEASDASFKGDVDVPEETKTREIDARDTAHSRAYGSNRRNSK